MESHNIYTVDEYLPSEVIDFYSDLEIFINSLIRDVSSPVEAELGDMILDLIEVPMDEDRGYVTDEEERHS